MKSLSILILTTLFSLSSQARCPFEGLSLSHLEESPDFEVQQLGAVSFPQSLIASQQELLGDLSPKECKTSFVADQIRIKASGEIFTAYYSNDDECDGGNSYGVLVRGSNPTPENAVATIEDSDLWCL